MKQKLSLTILAVAVCAGSIILTSKGKSAASSDLMNDNVEALAAGEAGGSCSASANCYSQKYNNKTQTWEYVCIGSVSCSGTEVCYSGDGWVQCDGIESSCN